MAKNNNDDIDNDYDEEEEVDLLTYFCDAFCELVAHSSFAAFTFASHSF